MGFDWDGLLKELNQETEEKAWVLGLFVYLQSEWWKIVSSFIQGRGIDPYLRGFTIKLPTNLMPPQFWEGRISVFPVDRTSLALFPTSLGLIPPEGELFVHHLFFDPGILLLVLAKEDLSLRLRKALEKYSPPRKACYELHRDVNFKLSLYRFLFGFSTFLENTEPCTYHHSLRVALLAQGVAHRLGLPREEEEEVRIAGLIHDLGKIFIPQASSKKLGSSLLKSLRG